MLVVVPVHNEERDLGRCLQHIAAAVAAVPGIAVRVVVVLDACTDGSARAAAESHVEVVECTARSVGVARATGVTVASRDVIDDHGAWVATTDADSRVDERWLVDHLAAQRAGYDLLVGSVSPDESGLVAGVAEEWHRRHRRGPHVHGANLGIRLSRYRSVGGFPPLSSGEDVALVEALLDQGAPARYATESPVVTSSRRSARAPHGFAEYLTALADQVGSSPT